MTAAAKLIVIKLAHTAVWVFFNAVIFYLLYAVVVGRIDRWLWTGCALVGLECLVLAAFKMVCPFTLIARRYSASQAANFDIYLPLWLAKYNKLIYGTIVAGIVAGLVWRLVQ